MNRFTFDRDGQQRGLGCLHNRSNRDTSQLDFCPKNKGPVKTYASQKQDTLSQGVLFGKQGANLFSESRYHQSNRIRRTPMTK